MKRKTLNFYFLDLFLHLLEYQFIEHLKLKNKIMEIFILLFFYFVPFLIGMNKRNAAAIFALNLFFGWTVIGWFGALIWALTVDKK